MGGEVVRNSRAEVAAMVRILDSPHIIIHNHIDRGLCADGVHVDLLVLDVDHVLLAVAERGAVLLVVV